MLFRVVVLHAVKMLIESAIVANIQLGVGLKLLQIEL